MEQENNRAEFEKAFDEFQTAIQSAVEVSSTLVGVPGSLRLGWASFLFGRICLNGMSIISLVQNAADAPEGMQAFDHFSIAAIGRAAIETCILTLYLADADMTVERWKLVKCAVDLHDATHRNRMFRPLVPRYSGELDDAVRDFPEARKMLRDRMRSLEEFKKLPREYKDKLITGHDFIVGGIRQAITQIGWDLPTYEHLASYLSAFVHSAPISFHRAETHGLNYQKISDFQYGLTFIILEYLSPAVRSCSENIATLRENDRYWVELCERSSSASGGP